MYLFYFFPSSNALGTLFQFPIQLVEFLFLQVFQCILDGKQFYSFHCISFTFFHSRNALAHFVKKKSLVDLGNSPSVPMHYLMENNFILFHWISFTFFPSSNALAHFVNSQFLVDFFFDQVFHAFLMGQFYYFHCISFTFFHTKHGTFVNSQFLVDFFFSKCSNAFLMGQFYSFHCISFTFFHSKHGTLCQKEIPCRFGNSPSVPMHS